MDSTALPRCLIQQHASGDGCIQALRITGQSIVTRASACAIHASASPAPSLPRSSAVGKEKICRCAASRDRCQQPHALCAQRAEGFLGGAMWAVGRRKAEPEEARIAFGFHRLTVPGNRIMPVAPKASAERASVPRLPAGSCNPAAGSQSRAFRAAHHLVEGGAPRARRRSVRRDSKPGHVNECGNSLRMLRCGDAGEHIRRQQQYLGVTDEREIREQALIAAAHQNRAHVQPASYRLPQQMITLDGDLPLICQHAPPKASAQFLHPGILPAFYLAETVFRGRLSGS